MPAFASCLIASSRFAGVAVRGSMTLVSAGSRVIIERITRTIPCRAMDPSRSLSRVTSVFFVITPTGLRWLRNASRHPLVSRSTRSTGW